MSYEEKDILNKEKKIFPLGCDVAKEEIFNYPYLTDENTTSLIKEHGHIMFIIRGPNSTLKATLSEMIMTQYPTAQHCCADHFFSKTFSPPNRNKETLKLSHNYCEKKVETACMKNESPIIVQNTHIRKTEMQKYLDLAAVYNYTVVMAVTLYKFDVTPEALERINPDGLNRNYFQYRLRQWQDISPLFTGWFLNPDAVTFVLKSLKTTLSTLLNDGKFCRVFNCYDNDAIWSYFAGRRNLYCIAGYSCNPHVMKKYYLSNIVQECYGKSYFISIHGYLITQSGVIGIVQTDEEMSSLLIKDKKKSADSLCQQFDSIGLNDNMNEYKATISFCNDIVTSEKNMLEDEMDDDIDLKNCKFIHIAQKKLEPFDIRMIKDTFLTTLNSIVNDMQYTEIEDIYVCRLPNDEWFVKVPKKIKVKTLFTGLYI